MPTRPGLSIIRADRDEERLPILDSRTDSIGLALRDAREEAHLSIEEAAWRTRIRPEYLRALENDDHAELGEAVFVRGHLLSYARYLNLDTGDILEVYDRDHQDASSPIKHLDRQVRIARRPKRPRWLLAALAAAAALIAVSAVGLVHGPGEKPVKEAALPVLPRLDQPQAASRSEDDRAAHPTVATGSVSSPLVVAVAARKRCWVQVVSDGKTVFSRIVDAGGTQTFNARSSLMVTLGNAANVQITFNGSAVSPSASGVWHGTFTPSGLQS